MIPHSVENLKVSVRHGCTGVAEVKALLVGCQAMQTYDAELAERVGFLLHTLEVS